MRDHELYATILGVQAPWTVERVDLDVAGGAVHVWLARREDAAAQCPECQTACPIYDHREREWRHLDTCQLQTRLHARVPRVECPTHGVVQTPVPWALRALEDRSAAPGATSEERPAATTSDLRDARTAFEVQFIAKVLREHNGNVSRAAQALGISRVALQKKMKEYGLR